MEGHLQAFGIRVAIDSKQLLSVVISPEDYHEIHQDNEEEDICEDGLPYFHNHLEKKSSSLESIEKVDEKERNCDIVEYP